MGDAGAGQHTNTEVFPERFADGPVVVFTWRNEPEWPVEYVSPNVERLFGYSPGELYDSEPTYAELVYGEDRDRVKHEVERNSDETTEQFSHEPYRLVTKEGDVRWVLDYTHLIREGGEITHYTGYIVDITEQKEQEVRLEQAESIGQFGSWKLSYNMGNVWWSDALYGIFERPMGSEALDEDEVLELVHPDDRADLADAVESARIDGENFDITYRIVVGGRTKWLRGRAETTTDADGKPESSIGVVKDITEQKERERGLQSLNETARRLLKADSSEEIFRTALDSAAELFDVSTVDIYGVEPETECLRPIPYLDRSEQFVTSSEITAESPIWSVLENGEPEVVMLECMVTPMAVLVVPLGEHGVLLTDVDETDGIGSRVLELAGVLSSATTAALDRADRTRSLEVKTEKLRERAEQLEYVNDLNATIRSLHTALIGADSRDGIQREVCETLTNHRQFAGAWIGTVDPKRDVVAPVASSGVPGSLLTDASLELDPDSSTPAVRAIVERSAVGGTPETPTENSDGPENGDGAYESAFAVPLHHREMVYGVMTVYGHGTDVFDDRIRNVLRELGTLVGYAITAVERRNALYSEGSRELVIDVTIDHEDPIRSLARELSGTVEVQSVSQRKRGESLLHCLLPDIDPEMITNAADTIPEIRSIEPLSNAEHPIYESIVGGACTAEMVTSLGASLRSMRIAEHDCELVVAVRSDRDRRQFIEQVKTIFCDAGLKAERDVETAESLPWPTLLDGVLTDQQQNVLKTAYHSGYFDANRKRTGAEIAESIGIAQPTFSNHVRAAQRNLLSSIWGDGEHE